MLRRPAFLSLALLLLAAPAADAGKPCRRTCSTTSDTTAPAVAIASPAGGATVSGTVTVSGTASDNVALAAVDVSVDNGAWQRASGAASWATTVSTTGYADGTHTLVARATDTSGNARVTTTTVTFRNDTAAPSVAIATPGSGATVSGTVTVAGSASDDRSVARVDVSVDNGGWQSATGTTSWSTAIATGAYADGTHTITARATDAAGNTRTASTTVTVRNATTDTTAPGVAIASPASGATVSGTVTVTGSASDDRTVAKVETSVDGGAWVLASGTSSWSASISTSGYANGTHTITARATDGSGNTRTASVSVTVSNSATAQSWTSPEGAKIVVDSAGGWTVDQIYKLLKENALGAGDFARVAPTLTVKVQDTYPSQATTSAVQSNGQYTSFAATIYLKGVSSAFATQPDAQMGHEYGHAWTQFHRFLDQNGAWQRYLDARGLSGNPNLDTSYTWDRAEIIADDYRLLFGSANAVAQRPRHMNSYIADPRDVPGLRSFFLDVWAA